MTDNVYVNADRTEVVDSYSPGKKWQVSRREAKRLGLLKDETKPVQVRRSAATASPDTQSTTNEHTSESKPVQRRRTTKKK